MGYVLFISGDASFNRRVKSEASEAKIAEPLFSTTLSAALAIITKADQSVCAIFVDSSDASYSLLKFIEHCAVLRPATPVIIIDSEFEKDTVESDAFLNRNHLRYAFNRTTPLIQMLASIRTEVPTSFSSFERRQGSRSEHGYIGIPVVDFIQEQIYPFDLFVETPEKGFSLFANGGSPVDLEYLLQAARSTLWLYVNEDVIVRKRAALRNTHLQLMDAPAISPLWRTAEVLYNMRQMLNEFRKERATDHLIDQTLKMLNDFFHVVSLITTEESNKTLTYFIEQSKRSDHAIAAVALSMLMCKKMQYERNSSIEILGLASLLQDISLNESPLKNMREADLGKLGSEDQSFFRQHPLLSANILAQHTSVPEVVLQVIRQQHECKNRSGFPNRIGGTQLHPMSEILSLINAYLEETNGMPTKVDLTTFQQLERNVFPRYSESVISQFRSILSELMRENITQYSRDVA